jgi:hypothetical protein
MIKPLSAVGADSLAADASGSKIDSIGDPLIKASEVVVAAALASEGSRAAPRMVSAKGRRPSFPAETIVPILVHKRHHNLSGKQVELQLHGEGYFAGGGQILDAT